MSFPKIAIIGAGHNGLVCATYLARAGAGVTVFEAGERAGGLCITEELFPGYRVSSVASYFGMLRQEVIDELQLVFYGLETYLSDPAEIVLSEQGDYVFTPRDGKPSRMRIRGLTDEDARGWKRFWSDIAGAAQAVYPYYLQPETTRETVENAISEAGLSQVAAAMFEEPLVDFISRYTPSRSLAAIASTCTPGFATEKGSVFGCIHHGTAQTAGCRGAWGFARGGMGSISDALARAALASGVDLRLRSPVRLIGIDGSGTARFIELADGSKHHFDIVVSNADPAVTFGQLSAGGAAAKRMVEANMTSGNVSAGKVHFALSGLPPFPVLEEIGHNYHGVIVSAPPVESIVSAACAIRQGLLPQRLMITMAFPSLMDSSVSPRGKQLLNVDIHYLPAFTTGEDWNGSTGNDALLELTVQEISRHSPSFESYIEDVAVITPRDLATRYRLKGRSCWHLPLTPNFVFEKRPGPRTEIANLYLCGAGAYPSGNVTGAPGYNCARAILSDRADMFRAAGGECALSGKQQAEEAIVL